MVYDEYGKPQKAAELDDEEWDEEYEELLEEMACQDQSNSKELEMIKKDRVQRRNRKLVARKKATQAEMKDARDKKEQKKQEKIKINKDKLFKKKGAARTKRRLWGGVVQRRPAAPPLCRLCQWTLAPAVRRHHSRRRRLLSHVRASHQWRAATGE